MPEQLFLILYLLSFHVEYVCDGREIPAIALAKEDRIG